MGRAEDGVDGLLVRGLAFQDEQGRLHLVAQLLALGQEGLKYLIQVQARASSWLAWIP
ncbi:hypothetical protein D3C86_2253660 [compost metagenome]